MLAPVCLTMRAAAQETESAAAPWTPLPSMGPASKSWVNLLKSPSQTWPRGGKPRSAWPQSPGSFHSTGEAYIPKVLKQLLDVLHPHDHSQWMVSGEEEQCANIAHATGQSDSPEILWNDTGVLFILCLSVLCTNLWPEHLQGETPTTSLLPLTAGRLSSNWLASL